VLVGGVSTSSPAVSTLSKHGLPVTPPMACGGISGSEDAPVEDRGQPGAYVDQPVGAVEPPAHTGVESVQHPAPLSRLPGGCVGDRHAADDRRRRPGRGPGRGRTSPRGGGRPRRRRRRATASPPTGTGTPRPGRRIARPPGHRWAAPRGQEASRARRRDDGQRPRSGATEQRTRSRAGTGCCRNRCSTRNIPNEQLSGSRPDPHRRVECQGAARELIQGSQGCPPGGLTGHRDGCVVWGPILDIVEYARTWRRCAAPQHFQDFPPDGPSRARSCRWSSPE
jgi:hypothetical protein